MTSHTLKHAEPDSISPSPRQRQCRVLTLVIAAGALGASAGLAVIDDPRPLDLQLSTAMREARDTLGDWQAPLSQGVQVSLRAVGEACDLSAAETTVIAQSAPASQPVARR